MKELGRKVRQRRLRMKWTQKELGRHVGRSHSWVSNIEAGKAGDVPSEVLTALAVALGEDPVLYLQLAGRALLAAEGVTPAAVSPEIVAALRTVFREELEAAGLLPPRE